MYTLDDTKSFIKKELGPTLRNVVQNKTRKYKKSVGCCEHCSTTKSVLEFAHIRGHERPTMIEMLVEKHYDLDCIIKTYNAVKNEFSNIHDNPSDIGLVLCNSCHRKYDEKG